MKLNFKYIRTLFTSERNEDFQTIRPIQIFSAIYPGKTQFYPVDVVYSADLLVSGEIEP